MRIVFINLFFLVLLTLPCYSQSNDTNRLQPPFNGTNVYSFDISSDGRQLCYFNGDEIVIFSLINNEVDKTLRVETESPIVSIVMLPYAETILLGTKSGKLLAISENTGELRFEKDFKAGSLNTMAVINDGRSVLCGFDNGMVFKQAIDNINDVNEFYQHDKAITSITVSDEKQLIAVSSGDGTISIFHIQSGEWLQKIEVSKKWLREVVVDEVNNRLLCVGDDGKVYEWNIKDLTNPRLIRQSKVSRNWLLGIDVGHDGKVVCWGGLDHQLKVRTQFGTYEQKFKGPLLKMRILETESSEIMIACCILGKGIRLVSMKEMNFKSIYN